MLEKNKSRVNSAMNMSAGNTEILGRAFWKVVREYGLSNKQVAILLDVTTAQVSNLIKDDKIPQKAEVYQRVGQILGIKKCLEIQYPLNPKTKAGWLKVKRQTFEGRSALEYLTENVI